MCEGGEEREKGWSWRREVKRDRKRVCEGEGNIKKG